MVTVGYGDISPQTHVEKVMSIFTILSACGVFAYSISEVGSIFQEMQKSQKLIKNNMHYLEYYWNESEFSSIKQEQRIINQLSDNLKENLLIEANKVFILESPILKKNFSMQTLLKTISIAQEQKYTPEEVIFLKGDMECSIYFIERGSVEVQLEGFNNTQQRQNKNVQSILKQGQFFGEGSFFTGNPRRQTFRSLEFTTLLKIEREEFIKIVEEIKEDYEMFCYIKDQIILNGSTQFSRKCCLCQSEDQPAHSEYNCPFLHFIPNIKKLQNRFIYQAINTHRVKVSRKCYKFKQNLVYLREIQDDQIKFTDQNNSFINEIYQLQDQTNQLQKAQTNLTFTSEDLDSEEDDDDILSIKNHSKNQSEKYIKSNGFFNSLGIKQNIAKKNNIQVYPVRKMSDQNQQRQSFFIEKDSIDHKNMINIKRASFQIPSFSTKKNSILRIDQSQNKILELKDKGSQDSTQQQQIDFNLQSQTKKQDILDQNQQNQIQGNTIIDNNEKNEVQRKTSRPFKKDTILINRNSIVEMMDNQASDDFNINPQKHFKKYSSNQSIQYQNNYSSINQSNHYQTFYDIENFDKMQNFEIYFPFNNYDYILPYIQKKVKLLAQNKRNKIFLDNKFQNNFEISAFSKSQRSLRKSISASKLNSIQNSLEKQNNNNNSYKIVLNRQESQDNSKLLEYEKSYNQNLLSPPLLKQLKGKTSFEENDNNDEKSSQILGVTRLNIQSLQTQSINSRKSFFNRKSVSQTIKVKNSLSQQLQNISQQNIQQSQQDNQY
ncbi:cyclic nucleotide-binding domain protein (macronuclear) [Tetrahymena thermophila SB210]|uniref:Cyclic nucleotide-binding domain protein n=1 Tax=Tetrahymena thermophila (strain SB210) TaxID=312017 RepID=I7MK55_TETTS|nr:cyclic nucleotide-binding domain protein [Tetrahymena thermophila SB210]EAR97549.2 cyclic nucleotide-binding domain protein [Tetrahymena thermophila SB210]|eukprot:XP_001017794.2 cyclic nucleotide-binding domain protein [Tetrahymena thermophila SB210]